MSDKFKNIKDKASDKLNEIKDGVSTTSDRLKHAPSNAAAAVSSTVKNISENVSTATSEKIHEWVDEFNAAVPAMKALGFSMRNFSIDIGIIPEARATLVGSVDALDPQKLEDLQSNAVNKALKILLNALLTTAKFKAQLTSVGIKGVEINIKLGLPPVISVNLLA